MQKNQRILQLQAARNLPFFYPFEHQTRQQTRPSKTSREVFYEKTVGFGDGVNGLCAYGGNDPKSRSANRANGFGD
jgi:hypothetical protein